MYDHWPNWPLTLYGFKTRNADVLCRNPMTDGELPGDTATEARRTPSSAIGLQPHRSRSSRECDFSPSDSLQLSSATYKLIWQPARPRAPGSCGTPPASAGSGVPLRSSETSLFDRDNGCDTRRA